MNSSSSQLQGAENIQGRLADVERLLSTDPAEAELRASALLKQLPGQEMAMLFQGIARRMLGKTGAAIEVLDALAANCPAAPLVHLQLGLALNEAGRRQEGVLAIRQAIKVKKDFGDAWLALAALLLAEGKSEEADEAFTLYVRYAVNDPRLQQAAAALQENRLSDVEAMLASHLQAQPVDIVALCMLAEVLEKLGRSAEAESRLKECLSLAPAYHHARHNYAVVLLRQNRISEAREQAERVLAVDVHNLGVRKLLTAILVRLREYGRAISICEEILAEHPEEASVWTSLGHLLKTVGQQDGAVTAYKRAISQAPQNGEPYWSLANLKMLKMDDEQLQAMLLQVENTGLSDNDRLHFHFAIGKALEDREDFAGSFQHYAEGNRIRLNNKPYNAEELCRYVERCKDFFTRDFFAERTGYGAAFNDPIFVLGLPRSGSTLVEQILSSHSLVEGTMELSEIVVMANSLENWKTATDNPGYPGVLGELEQAAVSELGQAYIEQTRIQRHLGRAFFIDKKPNNFAHIGLIHLILPRARIIDVRRHPLACGFSLFKEHFAGGQNFSYSLHDIGIYYRNYVELTKHFDTVLPGRVHRIYYESLVENTEDEIHRLLEYCELNFEASCLDFHHNNRPVSTASSEQVRSPIYRGGLAHWRNFEPWLGPLKDALGEMADNYPSI